MISFLKREKIDTIHVGTHYRDAVGACITITLIILWSTLCLYYFCLMKVYAYERVPDFLDNNFYGGLDPMLYSFLVDLVPYLNLHTGSRSASHELIAAWLNADMIDGRDAEQMSQAINQCRSERFPNQTIALPIAFFKDSKFISDWYILSTPTGLLEFDTVPWRVERKVHLWLPILCFTTEPGFKFIE